MMKSQRNTVDGMLIVLLLFSEVHAEKLTCSDNCTWAEENTIFKPNIYVENSGSKVTLKCHTNSTPEDFVSLRNIPMDNITFLEFIECPLTNCPLSELLELHDPSLIQSLSFKSCHFLNETLQETLFQSLSGLISLSLENNKLTTLGVYVFKNLTSLKNLNMSGNNLQQLPEKLLWSNKKLEFVRISNERKSNLSNRFFSNLPNLLRVDIQSNGLKHIPDDIFEGSSNLRSVNLDNNCIQDVSARVFESNEFLENLTLSFNQIESLFHKIVPFPKNLKYLDLSSNQLKSIIGMVPAPCFLETLDLANNSISFSRISPLQYCEHLTRLDVSHNNITFIPQDWTEKFSQLKLLNLSHNYLKKLAFFSLESGDQFFCVGYECQIDVSYNRISIIDLRFEENGDNNNGITKVQTWHLDGNPLSCSCSNFYFFRYLEKLVSSESQQMINFEQANLTCKSPDKWANVRIENIKSMAITCQLPNSSGLLYCPPMCVCERRFVDNAVIVNCTGNQLEAAPRYLPIWNESNHTELYLNNNLLQELPNFSFPGYEKLSKLDVSYNNITSSRIVGSLPPTLGVILLHNNNLSIVEQKTIQMFSILSHQFNVTFHNNPWKCDCQLQPLVGYVQEHHSQALNHSQLQCTDGQHFAQLTVSGLCSDANYVIRISALVVLLLGGLIGTIFALYFRFNNEIMTFLLSHNLCSLCITEEELDKEKIYDAFVSFSHGDFEFVKNELVPGLEEKGPVYYSLCLHYRDWIGGEWIQNQIINSIETSRRTIVVMSKSFMQSMWAQTEFRAAHVRALRERRNRLIVVLLDDIETEILYPELQAYLNVKLYIKWGDPRFWEHLRGALQHPCTKREWEIPLVAPNNCPANDEQS